MGIGWNLVISRNYPIVYFIINPIYIFFVLKVNLYFIGSDNESAAVTPARQTRSIRKDSNSNVDKHGRLNKSCSY